MDEQSWYLFVDGGIVKLDYNGNEFDEAAVEADEKHGGGGYIMGEESLRYLQYEVNVACDKLDEEVPSSYEELWLQGG